MSAWYFSKTFMVSAVIPASTSSTSRASSVRAQSMLSLTDGAFRTGTWRMQDFSRYGFQANAYRKFEPDLPGADEKVKRSVFAIDNVMTNGR